MLEINGATIEAIRTTKDGGWRIIFDLPGTNDVGVTMVALNTMREVGLDLTISEQPK